MVTTTGQLPYNSWDTFREAFASEFCPKNDVQNARAELETNRYHQGNRSVDDYVERFTDLVDRAGYTEGAAIVLKFRRGLDSTIQNQVACLTHGRPSDDTPQDWYDATILADENRIANAAFQSSIRANRSFTPSAPPGLIRNPQIPIPRTFPISTSCQAFAPTPRYIPPPTRDPNAMDVDANRQRGPSAVTCYRCGKTGHVRKDCPHTFDVRFMTTEEREDFIQQELAAMDVRATSSSQLEEEEVVAPPVEEERVEEETQLGFPQRSE